MKKLFFAIIGLTGLAATAMPNIITDANYETILQEKQYKKIQVSEIKPEAMEKIKKGYGQYTVKEAYRADDGEYKLVLSKDGVDITATFTAAGDLIKIIS
ncbi:hypothetical protein AM493_19285 [Flavobacterium akiainvivens]|uniref:PepSY domain-containing protein n=1 Tax=Flavobacterium akiainvivens TaxID=1202724 RepID=A0A0M8MFR1_9FLAO|nr:hypothetical protein [Flavobacterium akiainvivens]KOS07954.1 hypothetical protein AM493_19285 [Flavobacterium akiainvivens]SFQ61124.1 hypothetical protein SAMN05444144_1101 [Flavobacterium akiainvivens]